MWHRILYQAEEVVILTLDIAVAITERLFKLPWLIIAVAVGITLLLNY